ncbi:MAG: riboflavin biosynthesis protein RibF [Muribaculaceae bacterium]|nr:riboflavin biosynthesis protein RibF [Muribaculaceae bacterium]
MDNLSRTYRGPGRRAATVGTFDGVHLGHRLVLDTLRRRAAARGLEPIAVTFDRHPLLTVAPERAPRMLGTYDDKISLIRACGVTPVTVKFTEAVRSLRVVEWMERLKREFGVDYLLLGYDNTFGSDGLEMRSDDYVAIGETVGIEVEMAPEMQGVSSSAIRRALNRGEVEEAAALLGRPYSLEGSVGSGRRLGRTIGFPTANLNVDDNLLIPARGVYACIAATDDGTRHPAMVNIGLRPSVGDFEEPTVEAHLIGYEGDLYDRSLRLEFIRRLRDEVKFPSLDALKARLTEDAREAEEALQPIIHTT